MATKSEIKEAINDWLATQVSLNTSITNEHDHVGLLNRRSDGVVPYVGFEAFGSPRSRGFGGNIYVDDILYDANDYLDAIVYRRETTLTVEIGVLAESPSLVDDLYTAIEDEMGHLRTHKGVTTLHEDIASIEPRGFSDGSADIDVHDERLTYDITYKRYTTWNDVPAMEDISFKVEAEGVDTPHPNDLFEN